MGDCAPFTLRSTHGEEPSPVLHLAKIPPDPEGQLAAILAMFRKLTGREPTPEEIEDARKELEQ
jgi:hypothetical protein